MIPLVIDLLDPKDCASLVPRILEMAGRLDILHANAGSYVGGDLVDADNAAIDRMLNLNVNVVMKNVHDVLPTWSIAGRATSSSRVRLQPIFRRHGSRSTRHPNGRSTALSRRCGDKCSSMVFASARSRRPVITGLLADWPAEKLKEARKSGSLLEASEVANVVMFMLTRPRGMTIRDVVMMPTNFDL